MMKQRVAIQILLTWVTVMSLFLAGCEPQSKHQVETDVPGQFTLVTQLAPDSKAVVEMENFINFSCPACYRADKKLSAMLQSQSYRNRVQVKLRPVVNKNASDEVLRLFHVARKQGKEAQAIELLFQAKFERELDFEDAAQVTTLAKELKLSQAYLKHREASWVTEAIQADYQLAKRYNINSTPSWIIEQQLNVHTNFDNLTAVLDGLLKDE